MAGTKSLITEAENRLKQTLKPSEKPGSKPAGISEYREWAEKIGLDPNLKATQQVRELKGNVEPNAQREGLTALNTALTHILAKLSQKGVNIDKIDSVSKLETAIETSGIELNLLEAAAITNLERILNEAGPTARELSAGWHERAAVIHMAKQGIARKYLQYLKNDPISTVALTVSGAAGICLAYQGLKALVKYYFSKEKPKKNGDKEVSWFKNEIIIPLVIIAAAAILGKDTMKRILAECGLDFDDLAGRIHDTKGFASEEIDKLKKAGQKIRDALATHAEDKAPSSTENTFHPEYGYEMVPMKEAWKNYRRELYTAFSDVTKFVKENPGVVTAGALYLSSIEKVRETSETILKAGFQGFCDLAKIPFRALKKFPLQTLFAVSAIFAAESKFNLKDKAGNLLIPKDPENLKKYIAAKLEYAKEHGEAWFQQIPGFDVAEMDLVIDTILHPESLKQYLGKAEEVLANVIETSLERYTLSREKMVQEANYKGLDVFYTDVVAYLQPEEKEGTERYQKYTDLLRQIESAKVMLKAGTKLTRVYIDTKLKPLMDPLNLELVYDESGYVMWDRQKESENGLRIVDPDHPPKRLCIDPDRPLKEAAELAQKMAIEDNALNAVGKVGETALNEIRLVAGNILFEDAETDAQAAQVLQRKFRGGWAIAQAGLQLLIYEPTKGIWHKYYSGPFQVLPKIAKLMAGSKDVSATEVAVEYGQGIVPVYVLGQASALLRMDFAAMGLGKPLLRAMIYPIELAKDASVFTFRHIILNMFFEKQPVRAIFGDPKMAVFSDVMKASHTWRRILGNVSEVKHERELLARMYEAKKILHQAIYKAVRAKTREAYLLKATNLLKGTGEAERALSGTEISSQTQSIRDAISKLDQSIGMKEQKLADILKAAAGKGAEGRKAVQVAGKGEKVVETADKLSEARRVTEATEDVAKATRKGFMTAEEAARLGLRVEEVTSKGGKFLKFAHIGGRIFVVVDAILSVYDVYDQACELGKTLSTEYVETNSILGAMRKIAEHGESMAASAREAEAKENRTILDERNLARKLYGARELASKLRICAELYGTTRHGVSGDSIFQQAWDTAGTVLSELVLTPTIMRAIYGSETDKLRSSENKTIEMNIQYANEVLGQLKQISSETPEIRITIEALESSVALARKAIQEDKRPSDAEIEATRAKLEHARELAQKVRSGSKSHLLTVQNK